MLYKVAYIILIVAIIIGLIQWAKEIYKILTDNKPRYSKVRMTIFVTVAFSISSLVSLGYGSYVIDKYLK